MNDTITIRKVCTAMWATSAVLLACAAYSLTFGMSKVHAEHEAAMARAATLAAVPPLVYSGESVPPPAAQSNPRSAGVPVVDAAALQQIIDRLKAGGVEAP